MNLPGLRWKSSWQGCVSGAVCGLVAWSMLQFSVIRGMEEWMLDGCFYFRGPRPSTARIVLIDLDTESLDQLRLPQVFLSPSLAEVITFVNDQGAAAIGVDFMIPESLAALPELQMGEIGDATTLGKAIDRAGNVVLPEWKLDDSWGKPLPQWCWKTLRRPAEPSDFGFVNLSPDEDHFVRRQQLYGEDGGDLHMHFALALYVRAEQAEVRWEGGQLWVGERPVPLDEGSLRINYVGPPRQFPVVSFRDVLAAAREQQPLRISFRNAVVIIGAAGAGTQDVHATPFGNNYWRSRFSRTPGLMSGTELHANIVATLHDRAFIKPIRWITSLAALVVIGAILGFSFAQLNRIRRVSGFLLATSALFVMHHFAWKMVCIEAFTHGHWRIEMLAMLFLGLFVWLGNFVVRWLSIRGILRVVTGPFGELLETEPRALCPGGEERVVTVLFADIRNFSQFARQHSPHQVITLLNRYFAVVVPIIEKHLGTVNQFMGDGLMVLFGALDREDDHALSAVRAALEMVCGVQQQQKTWSILDAPDFRIGIGIHTGPVIVGALGSTERLTYTAIGDTVNAAARIEAENKTLDTEILLSEATLRYLPHKEQDYMRIDESLVVELRGVGTMKVHPIRPTLV
jgi:adenylate cyclase